MIICSNIILYYILACYHTQRFGGKKQAFSNFPRTLNTPHSVSREASTSESTDRPHGGREGVNVHQNYAAAIDHTPQPALNVLPRQSTPSTIPLPRQHISSPAK